MMNHIYIVEPADQVDNVAQWLKHLTGVTEVEVSIPIFRPLPSN